MSLLQRVPQITKYSKNFRFSDIDKGPDRLEIANHLVVSGPRFVLIIRRFVKRPESQGNL